MAPLTAEEFQQEFAESDLMREYGTPVDRESAGALTATMARTIGQELVRGVFGMLKGKAPRRTARSRG
jgi:hypothetical protein